MCAIATRSDIAGFFAVPTHGWTILISSRHHPDKQQDSTAPFDSAVFLQVQRAYETLSDPDARRVYDSARAADARPPLMDREIDLDDMRCITEAGGSVWYSALDSRATNVNTSPALKLF